MVSSVDNLEGFAAMTRLSKIERFLDANDLFIERIGDDIDISDMSPVEAIVPGTLVCLNDAKHVEAVINARPAAVITDASLKSQLDGLSVLISSNVKLSHALVRAAFFDYDVRSSEWHQRHPSAVIHDTADIATSVVIGPGVVIGRNVRIAADSVIRANAVIEHDVSIGADTVVHAGVFVGYGCQIGDRVILKPGCVIGAEGFGFVQDDKKKSYRIPQLGNVIIEQDVVVGANCTIDRATYGETRISAGCKLDALCHLGHNAFLDEDCIIVAQSGIAGSTRFGKRVIATGQTGTLDHRTVVDDVVLVHRAGVTEDIEEPGTYATTPPQPIREYRRNIATFRKLHELRQRVRELEKRLQRLEQS